MVVPADCAMRKTVERVGPVVLLDYNDLVNGADLSASIEAAYGFDGLGLLVVKNVPGYMDMRERLLPLAHTFASLPEEVKAKTEHPESMYSFGWSHGKEKMAKGIPDVSKGSYYANPSYDRPFDNEELIQKYPSFCHPNIWPEEMPQLRTAFMGLGQMIVDVGTLVAKQCDQFVRRMCPSYPVDRLSTIIKESRVTKARLLHYFPTADSSASCDDDMKMQFSSWCGWHNDHGSLTGLTSAMYMNADGTKIDNPDPRSGLYVRSRLGGLIHAHIPVDCIAYQIGEAAQIHSGGLIQATPHCVRGAFGPGSEGVSRETFAVFMEPEFSEPMTIPGGRVDSDACRGSSSVYLPAGVPLLESRWNSSQDFGEFSVQTLNSYYADPPVQETPAR